MAPLSLQLSRAFFRFSFFGKERVVVVGKLSPPLFCWGKQFSFRFLIPPFFLFLRKTVFCLFISPPKNYWFIAPVLNFSCGMQGGDCAEFPLRPETSGKLQKKTRQQQQASSSSFCRPRVLSLPPPPNRPWYQRENTPKHVRRCRTKGLTVFHEHLLYYFCFKKSPAINIFKIFIFIVWQRGHEILALRAFFLFLFLLNLCVLYSVDTADTRQIGESSRYFRLYVCGMWVGRLFVFPQRGGS